MTVPLVAAALGLAVAAGVSPYATVAVIGLAHRIGWIGALPDTLAPVASPWVLTVAVGLTLIEALATLVPGVASVWEAAHAAIRPPLAAVLAILVVWGADPAVIMGTGLLAGTLAFGTSLTKLGARLAIDTSPEPVSNGIASAGELTFVALLAVFVWRHPVISLVVALAVVVTLALLVRAVWGMIWSTVLRARRPGARTIRA